MCLAASSDWYLHFQRVWRARLNEGDSKVMKTVTAASLQSWSPHGVYAVRGVDAFNRLSLRVEWFNFNHRILTSKVKAESPRHSHYNLLWHSGPAMASCTTTVAATLQCNLCDLQL
jgi:hypothetical protein